MYPTKSNSAGPSLRLIFWWLLAHLAETAIRVRSTWTGAGPSTHPSPIGGVVSSGGGTRQSEDAIYTPSSPGPIVDRSPLATGLSPLATGRLSLKPLALAGLAAYVMGIAVVLLIRTQLA